MGGLRPRRNENASMGHRNGSALVRYDYLEETTACFKPGQLPEDYEPCFYGWFGKSSFVGDRKQVEVWEIDRPHNSKLHPTMKPVELCEKGILNSSTKGQTVLDLFGGSGSTLIACEKTKRKCRMIEIDPSYCQVIIDRWEAFTGLKANPCLTNSHL